MVKEVMSAKYLEIELQVCGRNMIKKREERMLSQATTMAQTILNLTREGLSRSVLARSLWEGCVVPAVMYSIEVTTPQQSVINELETIQRRIGRFITQTPRSTA